MSRKRYTPEQIIGKLREAEVALAQGETAGQVCHTRVSTTARYIQSVTDDLRAAAERLKIESPANDSRDSKKEGAHHNG